ncbi:hypothetical protein BV455_03770 [Parageobacillus caldoxylosilyticus]|nr:hypothetical protein [Parageobacillus caldoxylosilyticus]QXJ40396.1 hypothetical protein BV455_03770 [Parageobacillus caldoxylosilyticus]
MERIHFLKQSHFYEQNDNRIEFITMTKNRLI